jgi:hypothetical protein
MMNTIKEARLHLANVYELAGYYRRKAAVRHRKSGHNLVADRDDRLAEDYALKATALVSGASFEMTEEKPAVGASSEPTQEAAPLGEACVVTRDALVRAFRRAAKSILLDAAHDRSIGFVDSAEAQGKSVDELFDVAARIESGAPITLEG